MKVYLCGGINGLSDKLCHDWRDYTTRQLKGVAECINPMRRDFRGREDESVNEIVEGDLKDIRECDIVLANCVRPSWGTGMEIFYAHSISKQVLSVVPSGPISPWLRKHSHSIHKHIDDAIKDIFTAARNAIEQMEGK